MLDTMVYSISCTCGTPTTLNSQGVQANTSLSCQNCGTAFVPSALQLIRKLDACARECATELEKPSNITIVSFSGSISGFQ